ncbi:hypothetical protein BKA70DRAFT_1283437 [Coprinopsis sp. MPI-PUGE-AT-0042]|nr:hypothetical protein BKA70DRAFT_1283437 [Coprinopsis sp. MPI-PUGE-AT-0042]
MYVGAIWGLRVLNVRWSVNGSIVQVCDYVDTFRREVAYIWPGKMNLGKILFLIARYTTFLDSIGCQAVNTITAVSSLLGIATSCGLLAVSIYAILGSMKRPKMILLVLAVSMYITIFTLMGIYAAELFSITIGTYPELGCLTLGNPSKNYIFFCYCLLLVGEATLTGMVIYLGVRKYLTQRNPLLNIMYGDGTLYFLATLSKSSKIQRVLHPIFANRLLLNMREHEAMSVDGRVNIADGGIEMSRGQEVLSDIRFADTEQKENVEV